MSGRSIFKGSPGKPAPEPTSTTLAFFWQKFFWQNAVNKVLDDDVLRLCDGGEVVLLIF